MGLNLTNAQKALILAVISAGIGVAAAFGAELSDKQIAAINALVDAVLALWVGLTANASPGVKENFNALTGGSR